VQPVAVRALLASVAFAATACWTSTPEPAAPGDVAFHSKPMLADLCSVLERAIAAAPSGFATIRGERIETPDGVDRSPWSASTLTLTGGRAVVVHYAWDFWQLSFAEPPFSQRDLANEVASCAAVAGWQRGEANEYRPGEPRPLRRGTVRIVFHSSDTDDVAVQVVSCKTAAACFP
jgi:hypothetical protein